MPLALLAALIICAHTISGLTIMTQTPMHNPILDSRIGRMLYVVHDLWRHTRRWQDQASSERGLTIPQFRAIANLCSTDGIKQSELAERTDTDPMTVSGIIERLEAKGYVRREPDPNDSRAKLVFVTDVGRELVTEVRAQAVAREPLIFEGISDAEYEPCSRR